LQASSDVSKGKRKEGEDDNLKASHDFVTVVRVTKEELVSVCASELVSEWWGQECIKDRRDGEGFRILALLASRVV
jgi:hypothetical protein